MLWGVALNLHFTPQLSHRYDFYFYFFLLAGVFARLLLAKQNVFWLSSENRMVTEKEIFAISFFFFPSCVACSSNWRERFLALL